MPDNPEQVQLYGGPCDGKEIFIQPREDGLPPLRFIIPDMLESGGIRSHYYRRAMLFTIHGLTNEVERLRNLCGKYGIDPDEE